MYFSYVMLAFLKVDIHVSSTVIDLSRAQERALFKCLTVLLEKINNSGFTEINTIPI